MISSYSGSETELQFHSYLSNTNSILKFSLDYSLTEIHFLDLKIFKNDNGGLHTSIFREPDKCNTLLLRADSFHPPWLIDNIPFVSVSEA